MHSCLVTGSSGLIGSEVSTFFHQLGFAIHGIDNNQRAIFFGSQGDTRWNQARLSKTLNNFEHHEIDIRDRAAILGLMNTLRPSLIVNTAAQPSHDRAATIPFDDFDTNAVGTLNLLDAARRFCPASPFVHMSTNKVYGDLPNSIPMKEHDTRWDYDDPRYVNGIPESFSIDQSKHSLFGASKVAADILVQEYGRSFGMPSCCLRGGCLTGPNHSGVELHGFLSYLVRCNLENANIRFSVTRVSKFAIIFIRRMWPPSLTSFSRTLDAGKFTTLVAARELLFDIRSLRLCCDALTGTSRCAMYISKRIAPAITSAITVISLSSTVIIRTGQLRNRSRKYSKRRSSHGRGDYCNRVTAGRLLLLHDD